MSRFLLVVVVVSLVTVARCSVLLLVKLFPEETKRRHKTRFPFLLYLPRSSSWQFVLFLPVRLLPPTPSRSSVLLPPLYLSLHLPLPSSPLLHFLPPFLLFLSFSSPSFLSFSLPFSLSLSPLFVPFLRLPISLYSNLSIRMLFLSLRDRYFVGHLRVRRATCLFLSLGERRTMPIFSRWYVFALSLARTRQCSERTELDYHDICLSVGPKGKGDPRVILVKVSGIFENEG